MRVLRLALFFVALTALLVACGGGTVAPWTYAPASVSPSTAPLTDSPAAATATPSMTTSAAVPQRIAVLLTDTMRIQPATIHVPANVPVTFVVTNEGKIDHEFTLGDADVQDEHEQEMMAMGGMGMTHDEPNAIRVAPGTTKELTFTFEGPGMSLAGCHVPGHYPAGMMATISVGQ